MKEDEDPFQSSFGDPLCKLNMKESSDLVKAAIPITTSSSFKEGRALLGASAQKRVGVASVGPSTPVFGFRKSVPSKWDDAEKWLVSSSCHDSPVRPARTSETSKVPKKNETLYHKGGVFSDNLNRVVEEKLQISLATGSRGLSLEHKSALHAPSSEVFLKDKMTGRVTPMQPIFQYSETLKDAAPVLSLEVHQRDVGTEMTPASSSVTTRCHTPIKTCSPSRHNTPADHSGLLMPTKRSIDVFELNGVHLAKLNLGAQFDSVVSTWSSKEEEEEDISKSLRHSQMDHERMSIAEARAAAWEEDEKNKICTRYQREKAKIQAYVNLHSAKAEAQSRKLEVKIQKMRSNLEGKLMKKMATVHRKADEWRAAAALQHTQQWHKVHEQSEKVKYQSSSFHYYKHAECGCFPCNNHNHIQGDEMDRLCSHFN